MFSRLFLSCPEIEDHYREYIDPKHQENEKYPPEDKAKGYLKDNDKPVNEEGRRKQKRRHGRLKKRHYHYRRYRDSLRKTES